MTSTLLVEVLPISNVIPHALQGMLSTCSLIPSSKINHNWYLAFDDDMSKDVADI